MTTLRTGVLLLALAVGLMAAAPARVSAQTGDEAALARARELVELTGAAAVADQMLQLMVPRVRQHVETLNPGQGELVARLFDEHFTPAFKARLLELIDISAKLYASHFSAAELDELLAFYRTETGKKVIAKLPVIAQQSIIAGQAFAQQLVHDVLRKFVPVLKEKGLKAPAI